MGEENNSNADNGQNGGTGSEGSGGDNSKTFTQDDVNRIVSERLSKVKGQFGDYDDLKKKAEEFDKLQAANQTELEKEKARAEAAEKERDEYKGELTSVRTSTAIEKAAAKANLVDPGAAAKLIDRSVLEFDDNGRPTEETLKKALDSVVEEHSWLKGTRFQGGGDGGARGNGSQGQSMNDMIRERAGRG